jgi:RND family efflux transporter MFP subunit
MTKYKVLIIIVAASILSFIAYIKAGSGKGLEVKVITPERGVMTSSISATGKVVSGQESEVVSLVNSRVVKVLVKDGQMVPKGSLLVVLDEREALTKANASKALLSEARARADQAQRNLRALRTIYEAGGTSLSSVQDAELQCAVAQTAVKKAVEELHSSSLYLEHFKILAPFSGIIVKKNVQNGDIAAPGVSLLSLADMSKTEIDVSVDESDGGSLRISQEVKITCEALPNRTWTEKVVRIDHEVRKDGSANTLKTHVSFDNNKSELRLGQQVDVTIKLAEKKGVYKVPFDAVIHREGKAYIATIRENKVHFEPVVTGLEDASSVEILPPVQHEKVILSEGKSLQEGQHVNLATTTPKK